MTSAKLNSVHDGGRYFEGPRWHAGRLWFVDCMERTLLSLAPSGECEQHAKFDDDTPCGLGVLPDGRLIVLTMFKKRLFAYSDGKLSLYADLSGIATGTIDDMIVDGLGRAWVGDLGFDLPPPPDRGAVGRIILVMPDGAARVVAEDLRFPNGIAVSADNGRLVVAEMDGACLADYDIAADGGLTFRGRFGNMKSPDGICLDREGAVWVAAFRRTPSSGSTVRGANCSASKCPAAGRWLACSAAPRGGRFIVSAPRHPMRSCGSANRRPASTWSRWKLPVQVIPEP